MSLTMSPPLTAAEPSIEEHHWTVDEFYRAYEAGAFGYSKRWELIQGRIIEEMPPGPRHSYLSDAIAHMLRVALEPPLLVREEKAVHLAADSELVPDISVVTGERTDYQERHPLPHEALLLVEVADTTVLRDLGEKAMQYAQSGVVDYWVVLVNESVIVQHQNPSAEGYQSIVRLSGDDVLSPPAMPDAVWTVNALLGREEN